MPATAVSAGAVRPARELNGDRLGEALRNLAKRLDPGAYSVVLIDGVEVRVLVRDVLVQAAERIIAQGEETWQAALRRVAETVESARVLEVAKVDSNVDTWERNVAAILAEAYGTVRTALGVALGERP